MAFLPDFNELGIDFGFAIFIIYDLAIYRITFCA